ncbi:phosphatidylserine decarboxylase family protein [Aspergillus glaucus CBS 516.65]|uniref:L-tryptophan decarboxylase PsiD-like domain-containing protein n=1 Tax=Aspergillus glaucus CBS 516.65 TaxID=1160497 RepID=A0A1L9V3K5_ASPGL|nr:hypothetical protein ASPGLDRAFT_160637 [Aspergillus glaucus CBS 516.65]OJJ78524.1 hypothetical protein ASPGLDRAFT_160637 [Aspergillus glaucus CBS 516.65]
MSTAVDKQELLRLGDWMPTDPSVQQEWLAKVISDADNEPRDLHPVLREFGELIETDSVVNDLFTSTFKELPNKSFFSNRQTPKSPPIRDYKHFLRVLDKLLTTAPTWTDVHNRVGVVGMPINAVLDWPLGVSSGLTAFLNPAVNGIIKKVLKAWGQFLKSPESAAVLNDTATGWLGESAMKALTEAANVSGGNYGFDEVYVCDAAEVHYGFKSWDAFFTRPLREGVRPIAGADDSSVIINPCESKPYRVAHGVGGGEKLDVKGTQYSLPKMLGDDQLAQPFIGGTVYQAALGVLGYHRWHAPISGKVSKTYVIEGTYYDQNRINTGGSFLSKLPGASFFGQGQDTDPQPADVTATATRAVILIDSDNPKIGQVAFLAVGLAEVSTCEINVKEGDTVSKGSELGMFHYGGSTHCLLFRPGINFRSLPSESADTLPVNEQLAVVS